MEAHPDARVMGDEKAVAKLLPDLRALKEGGWHFKVTPDFSLDQLAFEGRPSGTAVTLWLVEKPISEGLVALRVTNVVPTGPSLSPTDYKSAIDSFFDVVQQRATLLNLELTYHVGNTTRSVDDYLSGSECMKKLSSFASCANVQVLHPNDRERWRAFCICCHTSRKTVPSEILSEHLVRAGFNKQTANHLAGELTDAKELLADYDNRLKSADQSD